MWGSTLTPLGHHYRSGLVCFNDNDFELENEFNIPIEFSRKYE